MVTNTHCLLPSGEFPYPAAHPHLPDPDGKQKTAKHTSLLLKTTSSLGSCRLPPLPVPSWSGQETSRCSEHRAPGVFACGPCAWLWSFSEAKGSQMEEPPVQRKKRETTLKDLLVQKAQREKGLTFPLLSVSVCVSLHCSLVGKTTSPLATL